MAKEKFCFCLECVAMPNQAGKHTQHQAHWAFFPNAERSRVSLWWSELDLTLLCDYQLKEVELTSQEQLLRMACNHEHMF